MIVSKKMYSSADGAACLQIQVYVYKKLYSETVD